MARQRPRGQTYYLLPETKAQLPHLITVRPGDGHWLHDVLNAAVVRCQRIGNDLMSATDGDAKLLARPRNPWFAHNENIDGPILISGTGAGYELRGLTPAEVALVQRVYIVAYLLR